MPKRRSPLALALLGLFCASSAEARIYPGSILVDDVDDLDQLYRDGLLTDDDYETLFELLEDPIDLNRARRGELFDLPGVSWELASRIAKSRRDEGRFGYLDDLLEIEGVTPEILTQIEPFVVVQRQGGSDLKGVTRVRSVLELEAPDPLSDDDHVNKSHTVGQLGYDTLPATYFKQTLTYKKDWDFGFAGYAQEDIKDLQFDQDRGDLYASWGTPTFTFAKAYAAIQKPKVGAIVGSYTLGFGNGLTFDRTSRRHPHGWYKDTGLNGSERFRSKKGLFGTSVRVQSDYLGAGSVDATLFVSSWRYDVYQYDLGIGEGQQVDPELDSLSSPRVYVEDSDGEFQKAQYVTVPDVYREDLLGADVTWRFDGHTAIGATAWAGQMDRTLIDGTVSDYDIVLRDAYPIEDTFGAAGVHGSYGLGFADLYGEVAHSFTGGNGYSLQTVFDPAWGEADLTLRRYDIDYDNPHARGTSNADEVHGFRDRDEQGVLLKTTMELTDRVSFRARSDLWQNISVARWNAEVYGRLTYRHDEAWNASGFAEVKNRDLSRNGRGFIYGGDYDEFEGLSEDDLEVLEVTDRAGAKKTWGFEGWYFDIPSVNLAAFYKRFYEDTGMLYPTLEGVGPCEYWYQIGHYTWFKARVWVLEDTALTGRVKYLDESVHSSHGDHYLESYLQLDQRLPEQRVRVSLRGTLGKNLADPAAEWADACSRAGLPATEGSCVISDSDTDTTSAEPGTLYGIVRASAEWRF